MSAPDASSEGVRRRMQAMRRRDTAPELELRRELHRRGLRYRVDHRLPEAGPRRRADIAFTRARVAVYVDGCFWHGCPEHGTRPRTNTQWWDEKIGRNHQRDRATSAALTAAGWRVLRFWEHEDPSVAAAWVEQTVRERVSAPVDRTERLSPAACPTGR